MSKELIVICAWCGKEKLPNGQFETTSISITAKNITHGICPDCKIKVEKEIE